MPLPAHTIYLIGGEDDESGIITGMEVGEDCELTFSYRNKAISAKSSDYFKAFQEIRTTLGKESLIPFCYGASLNVYPSSMARSMSRGLKAYKFSKGKHVSSSDLVDIFADGPDIIPAPVETQYAFYAEWAASPRA